MPSPSINVVKLVLSGVLLAIVAVRIAFDSLAERVDETALVLLGLAVLVPLVPWEKLSQFKAAGIELSLEQPQVRGALEGFSGVDNRWIEGLERTLAKVKSELPYVRGSRVLWVDDNPKVILGERRMFRALGAQVVSVTSSEMAEQVLTSDGDFDIVISDIQREGQSYLVNGGVEIHEGVNFVVKMRRIRRFGDHRDAGPLLRGLRLATPQRVREAGPGVAGASRGEQLHRHADRESSQDDR